VRQAMNSPPFSASSSGLEPRADHVLCRDCAMALYIGIAVLLPVAVDRTIQERLGDATPVHWNEEYISDSKREKLYGDGLVCWKLTVVSGDKPMASFSWWDFQERSGDESCVANPSILARWRALKLRVPRVLLLCTWRVSGRPNEDGPSSRGKARKETERPG